MTYGISPGSYFQEQSLTTMVPTPGPTVGAFAGNFVWGPCEEPVLNTSVADLISNYLAPTLATQVDFLTAQSYLAYTNALQVVRAYNAATALNSVAADVQGNGSPAGDVPSTPSPIPGILIKNANTYQTTVIPDYVSWVGRFAGALGNSLKLITIPNATAIGTSISPATGTLNYLAQNATSLQDITMYSQILAAVGRQKPSTTTFAASLGATNDQFFMFVVDYNGKFTGTPGTILESYFNLSLASNAINNSGQSLYWINAINTASQYIWAGNITTAMNSAVAGTPAAPSVNFQPTPPTVTLVQPMVSGNDGTAPVDSDYIAAYDFFASKEAISISLIMMGQQDATVIESVIQNIAEVRKDCVVFLSPPGTAAGGVVGVSSAQANINAITFRDASLTGVSTSNTLGGLQSTYAFMDCNWKYMYNQYLNSYVWVPCNADVAGLCAATDVTRAQWWSPAGFNRGILKNAIKLAWNPNETQRDDLYTASINPIVSFPGTGIVLFGDKTLTSEDDAFSRINVRRLFIVLETSITTASRYSLFEFNDQYTQANFKSLVTPFLQQVQAQRGVTAFYVDCGADVNTGPVVDSNGFIGNIYVQPARSINWILLTFCATPTGVAFSTIVNATPPG